MRKKRHTPEEIISKLRQVDVMVAQGHSMADAIRAIGVTEVEHHRELEEALQPCIGTRYTTLLRAIELWRSGAARLAAIPAGESPANRGVQCCCSHIQRREG